jgi:predicted transglutaminase-like cysteine proteinase
MFGSTGIMLGTQSRFKKARLGELLVHKGKLTQMQLDAALKGQKESGKQLGQHLCDEGLITKADLNKTLLAQFSYRALALSLTVFMGVASFGSTAKRSFAESAQRNATVKVAYNYNATPQQNTRIFQHKSQQELKMASLQTAPRSITPPKPKAETKLFGSREVKSTNLSAFTKWNDIIAKLDNAGMQNIAPELAGYRTLGLEAKIKIVNSHVNKIRYIEDKNNWGKSDYWASPAEFFTRGGDCEDFAIAKYAILKMLGVPENKMRLAIVQDRAKNIPHAVLIVYTENGPMMLDNQLGHVQKVSSYSRYDPIYSINREGWWRHLST